MKPQAATPLQLPLASPAPVPADTAPLAAHVGARSWLALEFAGLPLAALGMQADQHVPRAVSVQQGRRARVLAVDPVARAAGVEVGMSVAAATVLCTALQVYRHDPVLEAAALEGLACWALGYTSKVSLQPPRGLVMEIGGSLRLWGGPGPLLRALHDDLRTMGHTVSRGIAPTPTAAWLFARAALPAPVTVAERLADAVSRVPVTGLDLPPRVLDDLQGLGLKTLGDCMRLPRDGLTRRFGAPFLALLDRALGRCPDPRVSWSPPPCFERRLELDMESVDRGLLLEAGRRLLHELAGFLRAHASGACALELELAHPGMPSTRLVLELVSPSCDPRHLLALLAERLEHLPLRYPVCYLGMRVRRLQALQPEAGDLHAPHGRGGAGDRREIGQRAQRLVERLVARLGEDAVRVLGRVADHRPERGSAEIPWHRVAAAEAGAAAPASGEPLWLLPQPQELGGGPRPAALDGPLHLEQGPRRIESGWWDGDDVARDYYVARSSRGTRYWIFRECRAPGRWFVHGIFA